MFEIVAYDTYAHVGEHAEAEPYHFVDVLQQLVILEHSVSVCSCRVVLVKTWLSFNLLNALDRLTPKVKIHSPKDYHNSDKEQKIVNISESNYV